MFTDGLTSGQLLLSEGGPAVVVAVFSGSFDFSDAERVEDVLRAALREWRPRRLRLDLAAVEFCDCAALRALIRVAADGPRTGCEVAISRASPLVAWLVSLFELGLLFGYPPGEDAAGPAPGASELNG
ncbi:STAS domain-containing protein [Actinoplanes sp. NPDC051513]|uniref:STAS domain-containing protein n=1 Tax=Actinoplanes sp. NPDC051513 TaxID=3363908 RepID=UPI003788E75C